jgi:hypothetical protein
MGTQSEYGIKSCGRHADVPVEALRELLGPCVQEPGHSGACRFKSPGGLPGTLSVEQVEHFPEHPWFNDEEVQKYRKVARRLFWGSMAAFALNIAISGWMVLRALKILP